MLCAHIILPNAILQLKGAGITESFPDCILLSLLHLTRVHFPLPLASSVPLQRCYFTGTVTMNNSQRRSETPPNPERSASSPMRRSSTLSRPASVASSFALTEPSQGAANDGSRRSSTGSTGSSSTAVASLESSNAPTLPVRTPRRLEPSNNGQSRPETSLPVPVQHPTRGVRSSHALPRTPSTASLIHAAEVQEPNARPSQNLQNMFSSGGARAASSNNASRLPSGGSWSYGVERGSASYGHASGVNGTGSQTASGTALEARHSHVVRRAADLHPSWRSTHGSGNADVRPQPDVRSLEDLPSGATLDAPIAEPSTGPSRNPLARLHRHLTRRRNFGGNDS
ncbi:hypothetical protein P389DRAFT_83044 [Cystobasidium minutum MCA 4210]|uniref:uncharacterized protein n=1 Tax=Cystobasidium minutum MCA 4210 TaxID=1397322 RepID=UPI0034CF7D53|eukprot:jgi/Rhomi1/83044/CE83043_60